MSLYSRVLGVGILMLMSSVSHGVLISGTNNLQTEGTVSGNSITGLSFTSGGVTVMYDLVFTPDWLDSSGTSAPAATFSGSLFGGTTNGQPVGFETADITGMSEESRDIDGFMFDNGTTTINYYEELTLSVTNVTVSTSGTFSGFTGFTTGNTGNAGVVSSALPGATLTVHPGLMNDVTGNVDDSDFRLKTLTLEFDVTPVPEPNSIMLVGLLGVVAAGRRWKRSLTA